MAAHVVQAQTLFEWPDSKVNLRGYQYLDNCVAVGARVQDSINSDKAIAFDTMFSPRGRIGVPTDAKVHESLQECLSSYTPVQIPRAYTLLAQRTYLYAGRFADANAVVQHGLSEIASADTASKAALLDSVIQQYTSIPPFQTQTVIEYLDTLERYGDAYRSWNKLRDYFWLMHSAYVAKEDSVAFMAARRLLELGPEAIKGSEPPEIAAVGIGVAWAIRISRMDEILDSLRSGTSAYAALYADNLKKILGFIPSEMSRDVDAPVLEGDFWFPQTAATQEFPRKGRVSMVMFVPSRLGMNPRDVGALSVLRRLSRRYPTVDLVMVTHTVGHFGQLEPPTPEYEASVSDSVIRHFHQLTPTLSVTKGTFVQLEAPDNRRIYQPYPNYDAYPPDVVRLGDKDFSIYIIDDHRRVVDIVTANTDEEGWVMQLIDALLTRVSGGREQ